MARDGASVQPAEVMVVTSNEVPGHRVTVVFGEVFGLVVQARDYFGNLGAKFRTVVGGESGGYTKLLASTRDAALARLREHAASVGANAVIAARFDTGEIAGVMNEVAVYGTAVFIVVDESALPVRLQPIRYADAGPWITSPAQPGQRICANGNCEAYGLPTPVDLCDVCGVRTQVVGG